jgi:NADPH2:quinone reductase
VLDATCGQRLQEACDCLAEWGRVVIYGTSNPVPAPLDLKRMIARNQRVTGCFLGAYLQRRPQRAAELLADLGERVRRGEVKPAVHAVLPLSHAPRAHALMTSRGVIGKILLDPWMNTTQPEEA